MRSINLTLSCAVLLTALFQVRAQESLDELLMVFEITRHGARYGLHSDYFNETSPSWRTGELT
jgi:hypothetical protein